MAQKQAKTKEDVVAAGVAQKQARTEEEEVVADGVAQQTTLILELAEHGCNGAQGQFVVTSYSLRAPGLC